MKKTGFRMSSHCFRGLRVLSDSPFADGGKIRVVTEADRSTNPRGQQTTLSRNGERKGMTHELGSPQSRKRRLGGWLPQHDSGGYFGVPLSNFLGWLLVTWLYFQSFEIFIHSRRDRIRYPTASRQFWACPTLLYLAAGLCHLYPLLTESNARLVDAGGRVWSATNLRETAVIVKLFTMVPTSLLALLRLVAPEKMGVKLRLDNPPPAGRHPSDKNKKGSSIRSSVELSF